MDDLSLRVYLENAADADRGGWLELPVAPERLDAFMRGVVGVTRQTVFAWRHPRMRDSVPSPAAVDALDARWSAMVARASELAGMMSVAADRAAADGRRRMAPPLTFYRLRSDWEAWHGPDDGGWRSEDCSVWLAAVLLHDMGLEPSVVYAEADPEAMF